MISSMAQIIRQYSIPTVTIIYELHRNKSLILTLTLILNPKPYLLLKFEKNM